jgi:hypothetical protein
MYFDAKVGKFMRAERSFRQQKKVSKNMDTPLKNSNQTKLPKLGLC